MDFLGKLLLSFLPPRYRRARKHEPGVYLVRAASITALLEIVVTAILYARGFIDYIPDASIGPAAFLEFFFTWQGLLLAFFFLDGALRLTAAVAGQSLGTIPLYFVAWIHGALERHSADKRQPPLITDVVEHPEGKENELRISSCRPRKNWDNWMTVMYEEKLYEIIGAELASSPRPYVYFLRLKPESKIIRGLHRYNPDEVFHIEKE